MVTVKIKNNNYNQIIFNNSVSCIRLQKWAIIAPAVLVFVLLPSLTEESLTEQNKAFNYFFISLIILQIEILILINVTITNSCTWQKLKCLLNAITLILRLFILSKNNFSSNVA